MPVVSGWKITKLQAIPRRRNAALALALSALIMTLRPSAADAQEALRPHGSDLSAACDDKGTVTLQCPIPNTVIRYTVDGSPVGPKSGRYLAPIENAWGLKINFQAYNAERTPIDAAPMFVHFEGEKNVPARPLTLVPCTQDRDWPIYDWAQRHLSVSELVRERKPELIFIGDSITQMFGGEPHDRPQPGSDIWDRYYGKRNAANLGFGYDYVENTLWRLRHGELEGAQAKAVVLLIGTNNLGRNTVEEIVQGVHAICDEIHGQQPQATLVLMGIFPRGAKPDKTREKLQKINAELATLDGRQKTIYLDIGSKFLQPDGTLPKELMGDFLHPTAQGYEIWAAALEPTLQSLLKDKSQP